MRYLLVGYVPIAAVYVIVHLWIAWIQLSDEKRTIEVTTDGRIVEVPRERPIRLFAPKFVLITLVAMALAAAWPVTSVVSFVLWRRDRARTPRLPRAPRS